MCVCASNNLSAMNDPNVAVLPGERTDILPCNESRFCPLLASQQCQVMHVTNIIQLIWIKLCHNTEHPGTACKKRTQKWQHKMKAIHYSGCVSTKLVKAPKSLFARWRNYKQRLAQYWILTVISIAVKTHFNCICLTPCKPCQDITGLWKHQ